MSRATSDAPLDLEKGATGAKASSDAPVDVEKGATGARAAATEEEELAVVDPHAMDPRVAKCLFVSLDVGAVLYVFYYIGLVTLLFVRRSNNWWDPWVAVLILSSVLVWVLWMAPKMKYDRKSTPSILEW